MGVRFEFFISLFAITVLFLAFSPLLIFLQDLSTGKFGLDIRKTDDTIFVTISNNGTTYLKDVRINIKIIDQNGKEIVGNAYVKDFSKGEKIVVPIKIKEGFGFPKDVEVKFGASVFGVYEVNFEIEKVR